MTKKKKPAKTCPLAAAEGRAEAAAAAVVAAQARVDHLALGCLAPSRTRTARLASARRSLTKLIERAELAAATVLNVAGRRQAEAVDATAPIVGGGARVVIPRPSGSPEQLAARFEIVDVSTLTPSHDPTRGFAANSKYPAGVQERDYAKRREEQLKVDRMARDLIPDLIANRNAGAVDGTPVVDQRGIVLSGNGRTMAIQLAYARNTAAGYTEHLREQARDFGIRASAINRVKAPILVRRVQVDPEQAPRLVRLTNAALTQSLAAEDLAASRGRLAHHSGIGKVVLAHGGHTATSSAAWIRDHGAALIPPLERAGLVTDAERVAWLNPSGGMRPRAVEDVAEALGSAVLPATAEGAAQLRPAIVRSALGWLAAAEAGGDWDVRPAIAKAAAELSRMRAGKLSLARWRRQTSIEGKPTDGDPLAITVLSLLASAGKRPLVMAKIAGAFADASTQSGGLFGASEDPRTALIRIATKEGAKL